MASATPRLHPRPKQQNSWEVLFYSLRSYVRGPALAASVLVVLQPFYDKIYAETLSWPYRDALFFTLGVLLVHHAVFYSFCLLLHFYGDTAIFSPYRLERKKSQKTSPELVSEAISSSLFEHFCIMPFTVLFAFYFFTLRGMSFAEVGFCLSDFDFALVSCISYLIYSASFIYQAAPHWTKAFFHFFICSFGNDALFFWSHRLKVTFELFLSCFYSGWTF